MSEIKCQKTVEWQPSIIPNAENRTWPRILYSNYYSGNDETKTPIGIQRPREFALHKPCWKECMTDISRLLQHSTDGKRRMQGALDGEIDKNVGKSKYELD